jgi:hypothetical protein
MALETRECPFCGKRFLVAVDNTEAKPKPSECRRWFPLHPGWLVVGFIAGWGARWLWLWWRARYGG